MNLDSLMMKHVQTILDKDEPTVAELEWVRKVLNDSSRRSLETFLQPLDPAATAQKLYGDLKFDDLPVSRKDAMNAEGTDE